MPSVGGRCSLRHIIEPRPRYVKLDRGLVTGITADPIRQARGSSIGVDIIAEGVETEAERLTLNARGVGAWVRASCSGDDVFGPGAREGWRASRHLSEGGH